MKRIIVLGATGSLGLQALKILEKYKNHFKVVGITANKNGKLLSTLAKKHKVPKILLTSNSEKNSLESFIEKSSADIVVNVLSGLAGVQPTICALKSKKTVLLGNKESLFVEGKKIMKFSQALIPIDSEHNSIFEIIKFLQNQQQKFKIKKLILPCSGGPFFKTPASKLKKITIEQALNHPKWKMGPKISIESATLINKGLEVVEAHYLFNFPFKKIEVKIHPECKIHGMVEVQYNNSKKSEIFAYFAKPDMREHIENALFRAISLEPPNRDIRPLIPGKYKFKNPDHKKLPGIKLVLKAHHANSTKKFLQKEERAIAKFLGGEIKFTEIFAGLKR